MHPRPLDSRCAAALALAAAAVLPIVLAGTAYAQTPAVWIGPGGSGGDGSYTDAANWDIGVVPDNSDGTTTYSVNIDGGKPAASNVTLAPDPMIGFGFISVFDLTIDAGDALTVLGNSSITFETGATVDGLLTLDGENFSNGAQLGFNTTNANFLVGTGEVVLVTGSSGSAGISAGDLFINSGLTISGNRGSINTSTLLNNGTIRANTPSNTFNGLTVAGNAGADAFVNGGRLEATGGGILTTFNLTNGPNGVVQITGDADPDSPASRSELRLQGEWVNNGTINLDGGTLVLADEFTLDDLGAFNRTGGTVALAGVLDNTGRTLTLAETGTLSSSSSLGLGTIRGGRIGPFVDGATLDFGVGGSGFAFDGVTLATDLAFGGNSVFLLVDNDLTLDDATIALTGGSIGFSSGSQTLVGTGSIVLDGQSFQGNSISGETLTVESGVSIVSNSGPGGLSFFGTLTNRGTIRTTGDINNLLSVSSNNFVNDGTLAADGGRFQTFNLTNATAGAIDVAPDGQFSLGGEWVNNGTINLDGGILNLGGDFTVDDLGTLNRNGGTVFIAGTLDNVGRTLALDATTGSFAFGTGDFNFGGNGTIVGGTVTATGGAQLLLPVGQLGTLDGVTLATDLTAETSSALLIRNGLALQGAVVTNAGAQYILFDGPQTLDGTGEYRSEPLLFGGVTFVSGTLTVAEGVSFTGGGNVSLSDFDIDNPGGLILNGTLSPDDGAGGVGRFLVNTDDAVSFGDTGTYVADLGDPLSFQNADLLEIGGTLDLSGAGDRLVLRGGEFGETYTIATYASLIGAFDVVTSGYAVSYGGGEINVTVVPEPSSLTLLASSAGAALLRRRARRA